jgi:hypothetical protein
MIPSHTICSANRFLSILNRNHPPQANHMTMEEFFKDCQRIVEQSFRDAKLFGPTPLLLAQTIRSVPTVCREEFEGVWGRVSVTRSSLVQPFGRCLGQSFRDAKLFGPTLWQVSGAEW